MGRSFALAAFLAAAAASGLLPVPAGAQQPSPLAGVWSLNRSLSELGREIGFNPAWMTTASGDGQSTGAPAGGGGRRGASGGGARGPAPPFSARPESYEDSRRVQFLTAEARNPPTRLTIVDMASAVTITNELGQSRTIHPDGRQESIELQGVSFSVTSKRDGDQLVVNYRVDQAREVRYAYSLTANPARLVVEVQFLEHGKGDKARRSYDSGAGIETPPPQPPTPAGAPPAATPKPPVPEPFDQRPGAELRGLTTLGVLVETLSAQAVACGLSQDAIEGALSKRLTDGGFTVRRNSDDDTYVYVNIMTTSLSNGLCASRYDAFLYTHATAKLSYREQAVLVQVSLMHRGGLGTSAPAAHGTAVVRGLESYVDLFVTQIHDANK
ncbi:MAG TPA: hypothetical protein VNW93_09625 [Mycobacterium sp.]|nr:hypothetical protein [Mycobacterium sp.]